MVASELRENWQLKLLAAISMSEFFNCQSGLHVQYLNLYQADHYTVTAVYKLIMSVSLVA